MTVVQVELARYPQTELELWEWLQTYFGVKIPRTKVCPDHCAPWDAFVDAFFARSAVSVWKASRGFGGKSFLLATLATAEAVCMGADSSVLGGSAAQSLNVHEHSQRLWYHDLSPRALLAQQPTRYETQLLNGATIRALMASSRSVRGPHPQRLRLDEIDEMDLSILEAAQGQPMARDGVKAQTVMSSTHQYPDGTMSTILERAAEKGWPVFQWCYKESNNPIDGWLMTEAIEQKRGEVSAHMFATEYDLQEPSFEGRAIDHDKLQLMFEGDAVQDHPGHDFIHAEPEAGHKYVTGVDWAKEKDWTVIWTWDTTVDPWRAVCFQRCHRLPWPVMIDKVYDRMSRYKGTLVHDATGLGNVVGDYLDDLRAKFTVKDIVMAGRAREGLFNDWISAIEREEVRSPRVEWPYSEHLYCRWDDLYGKGTTGHPPDSFVAGALAWHGRQRGSGMVVPVGVTRPKSPWKL